ncbi:S8 family serine peptidase [Xanthobacter sp. DSM 24535]|uniref:S8 family serine peptidase n=1 Tax=Roseixanthobacter psychrophilus TaxID=3119917 RepID=UPI003727D73D
MTRQYIPGDPLFAQQWHLRNTGQAIYGLPQDPAAYRNDINVTGVWDDYTGAGVIVGVLDDGFQATHPDLAPNYLADKSYNYRTVPPGPSFGEHGTATMGLILAAENGVGGVGVAFDAKGIGYAAADLTTSFMRASARMLLDGVDVSSNSWGSPGSPLSFTVADRAAFEATLVNLVQLGRDGLGTVALFAGGNERENHYDTNFFPSSSSPYAITVAGANVDGTVSSYSTPGASILFAAPASGQARIGGAKDVPSIVTTDLTGSAGFNKTPNGDYTDTLGTAGSRGFNGTSAATPIAAGVVALMLEANPELGYRDVQEILAYSARTPASVATWTANAATDWNGGGHLYSNDLGFGELDALAAVRLAETWHKQSTYDTLVQATQTFPPNGDDPFDFESTVKAGETGTFSVSFTDVIRVQHATLSLTITPPGGSSFSGVTVTLTGPDGHASSTFLNAGTSIPGLTPTFTFDTVHDWGELSTNGIWTLTVSNAATNPDLSFVSSLTLLGDRPSSGQTFIYTDDYARLGASDPARAVLRGDAGVHAINAAAVTGDTIVDLANHAATIAGVATTIDGQTRIGTVITGDGNDNIVGDAGDNIFLSGRGDNQIIGGGGTDTLELLKTLADYTQLQHGNSVVIEGSASHDTTSGISTLEFADGALTLGTNALVTEIFYALSNPDVFAADVDADAHYANFGWREGRDPNAWFSTTSYLANHADVRSAGIDPLDYYDQVGWKNGDDPSAKFDASLYLKLNPDVAASGMDPLRHYLEFGEAEGRKALPVVDSAHLAGAFDPTFYKLANPDVALSGMDALTHFLTYGKAEGRDPDAFFDISYYLAANPDVAAAGVDPLQHYLDFGWKEGRDPSSHFDTSDYLTAYVDVKEAGMDPLLHFLRFGIAEGRSAFGDL